MVNTSGIVPFWAKTLGASTVCSPAGRESCPAMRTIVVIRPVSKSFAKQPILARMSFTSESLAKWVPARANPQN